ncbi:hypothetical protein [Pseudozobellia sp. WGM2]|uniref:hypothetical protein n=1 Tax=Pseudozobellia sp. WGM2 TaxID=2787625 RepID=UPI001AE0092D|nr:hypothetical protein [Pseudozobellia sp. WGM2]
MKTAVTLLCFVLFSAMALANNEIDVKSEFIKMDIVLVDSPISVDSTEKNETIAPKSIARLYKSKNSRVKKALSFSTKYNRAKLA